MVQKSLIYWSAMCCITDGITVLHKQMRLLFRYTKIVYKKRNEESARINPILTELQVQTI